jgi:hypothetical protein
MNTTNQLLENLTSRLGSCVGELIENIRNQNLSIKDSIKEMNRYGIHLNGQIDLISIATGASFSEVRKTYKYFTTPSIGQRIRTFLANVRSLIYIFGILASLLLSAVHFSEFFDRRYNQETYHIMDITYLVEASFYLICAVFVLGVFCMDKHAKRCIGC